MTVDNTTLAIVFIVVLVGKEFLMLAVRKFWLKTVDTEYVTVASCKVRCDACKQGRSVKDEDLVKMLRLVRSDIGKLYSAILKQMLHNNTPNEVIEEMLNLKIGGSD